MFVEHLILKIKMKFQLIKTKVQFDKIDSIDAGGWDLTYCETMYKVFYTQRGSFIYNLKDRKRTYFSFTDFDPFIISEKDDSIFLFKRENNMSPKKERTLFRYNLESGALEEKYDLSQRFIGIDRFELIKIEYVNDSDLAILVHNYDTDVFNIIVLNTETKKSIFVEIYKHMTIDVYQKNTLFVFEGELYIPYIIKENKRGLLSSLYRRNSTLKEQGILKYKNGKLEKVKVLDNQYTYIIFSDNNEEYLACIHYINNEYLVNIFYHNECILKEKYFLEKKGKISFKFIYSKNNNVLFVIKLKQKYEVFDLANKKIIHINLTEEQMEKSYILSNNIILFDDEATYDTYSDKRIRILYKFQF